MATRPMHAYRMVRKEGKDGEVVAYSVISILSGRIHDTGTFTSVYVVLSTKLSLCHSRDSLSFPYIHSPNVRLRGNDVCSMWCNGLCVLEFGPTVLPRRFRKKKDVRLTSGPRRNKKARKSEAIEHTDRCRLMAEIQKTTKEKEHDGGSTGDINIAFHVLVSVRTRIIFTRFLHARPKYRREK